MNEEQLRKANALSNEIKQLNQNLSTINLALNKNEKTTLYFEEGYYRNREYIYTSQGESVEILKMLRENNIARIESLKQKLEKL